MTIQGFILLQKMKKVQRIPNDPISVDVFTDTIETSNTNLDDRKQVFLRKGFWEKHLSSTLEDLSDTGYVTLLGSPLSDTFDFQITAKGQYIWQHFLGAIVKFLATSIITPIAVSFLTSLITLWILG